MAGLFQPLNTAIGLILVFLYSISNLIVIKFDKQRIKSYLIKLIYVAIPTLPIILYYGITQFTDPFYKGWTSQNIINSPNPLHYLIAYAVPVFVILAYKNTLRILLKNHEIVFLSIWIPVFLLLAYIPYNLQRRFPDGIFIALIVLMICVLEEVRKKYIWKAFNHYWNSNNPFISHHHDQWNINFFKPNRTDFHLEAESNIL